MKIPFIFRTVSLGEEKVKGFIVRVVLGFFLG